jgi:penicillin-binding protein 1A
MNIHQATIHSDNTIYMQMALDLGPENIKQTAYDMGITTHLDGYPAETLGGLTIGVSPLEMADAYATIASGGVWHKPVAITKIRKADGTVLKGKKLPKLLRPEKEKRFPDGVTSKVTDILEANMTGGTGTNAQIGCPAGGKTGTTDEHSDSWFVGITPKLATAVWVGYPQANIHMYTEYHGGPVAGATFPSEIWGAYMRQAIGGYCEDFPEPTEPMDFTSFYGRYATSRSSNSYGPTGSTGYTAPTTTDDPTDTTDDPGGAEPPPTTDTPPATDPPPDTGGGGGGGDDGGETYDPSLYESPPDG